MRPITAGPGTLPSDFVFGYATAAFQIEGANTADGRGACVWDELCKLPGKIEDGTDGSQAIDSYHLYPVDIDLLKRYGARAYRFSIAWPRIVPLGGRDDPVNEAGIRYYSDLVDLLIENDIVPYVTMFHWDLPAVLQDRYGGWTNRKEVSADFARYASVLFERLGDRVKNWITLNEPSIVCHFSSLGLNPTWQEDDLWLTIDSLIYSHALAVDVYRKRYQAIQGGQIGITLNIDWAEPETDSPLAKEAAQRAMDHYAGMFADPIYLGYYPESVLEDYSSKISKFTADEWKLIKGSSDFFGLNSYTTRLYTGEKTPDPMLANRVSHQTRPDGSSIGKEGECDWLKAVPWGFRKLLDYIFARYVQPTGKGILITENGFCVKGEHLKPLKDVIDDLDRQDYYAGYLKEGVEDAVLSGIPIHGYFAWSLAE